MEARNESNRKVGLFPCIPTWQEAADPIFSQCYAIKTGRGGWHLSLNRGRGGCPHAACCKDAPVPLKNASTIEFKDFRDKPFATLV